MPPGQLSGLLPCLSREKRPPPVSTSVKAFRHFIDGSLTLASPDHTCRNLVSAFLQRSPQPLLTAAACSGLRPAPDCRPRGAHPHLLHSTTSPYPGDVFVTHGACRLSREGAPTSLAAQVIVLDPHGNDGADASEKMAMSSGFGAFTHRVRQAPQLRGGTTHIYCRPTSARPAIR